MHPFKHDPFEYVMQAFENLYGKHDVLIQWNPIKDHKGKECYGRTSLLDDGTFAIDISPNLKIRDAIEVLGHELAHVSAGLENAHNKAWQRADDAIYEEYLRIIRDQQKQCGGKLV